MRTLIDMTDAQVEKLDDLARQNRQSRAALIRTAIDEYLDRHCQEHLEDAFGLWSDRQVDGLEYQEKLRAEW